MQYERCEFENCNESPDETQLEKDSETILNSSEIGIDDSLISTKAPLCAFDKPSLRELRGGKL